MTAEAWPVATSPATGYTPADDRCPICWSPVDGNQCHLHERPDIEIDEILAVVRRHLVYPCPVRDKALEEQ